MNTIQIRRHHGLLDDSIETMKEIQATAEAVREYLNFENPLPFTDEELSTLKITPYGGPDTRIKWNETNIVQVKGFVVAFTSGPIINEDGENKMDGFTAGALLHMAKGNTDAAADMYKSLNSRNDSGPSDEARAFVEKNMGKACKIKFTSHEAIIHKLNEATRGFYPGSRYPVYVKITNGESAGTVFEYDLDQIEIIE